MRPIAVLFFCFLSSPAVAQEECQVPAQLRAAIDHRWHGWKVLHIADLTPENQNLWTYARGRVCPGIAQGHFFDAATGAYAISLVSGHSQVLITARVLAGHWQLSTLLPPHRARTYAVLWAAHPGAFEDAVTGRKIQTDLNGIGFEVLEGTVIVFLHRNGSFMKVQTTH